jgi:RimJ/RimL family protein N-acetyltransferase
MNTIETERLILRMFRDANRDQYAEICADSEVMRYLGEGRPLPRAEAWHQMALIVGPGNSGATAYGRWRSGGVEGSLGGSASSTLRAGPVSS